MVLNLHAKVMGLTHFGSSFFSGELTNVETEFAISSVSSAIGLSNLSVCEPRFVRLTIRRFVCRPGSPACGHGIPVLFALVVMIVQDPIVCRHALRSQVGERERCVTLSMKQVRLLRLPFAFHPWPIGG